MTLLELADAIGGANKSDNKLDVLAEIALFKPNGVVLAVRANDAGTKVIYTIKGGAERTCWADDLTMHRLQRAKTERLLRALHVSQVRESAQ